MMNSEKDSTGRLLPRSGDSGLPPVGLRPILCMKKKIAKAAQLFGLLEEKERTGCQ